eukprot:GEMP01117928.1.p1 GENE.GEMP01117928.1~~GEMP01117928.1.p1  ORF type:complete len:100 (-),score=1.09 GEMP01117928.1:206-505(-)
MHIYKNNYKLLGQKYTHTQKINNQQQKNAKRAHRKKSKMGTANPRIIVCVCEEKIKNIALCDSTTLVHKRYFSCVCDYFAIYEHSRIEGGAGEGKRNRN